MSFYIAFIAVEIIPSDKTNYLKFFLIRFDDETAGWKSETFGFY